MIQLSSEGRPYSRKDVLDGLLDVHATVNIAMVQKVK